MAVTDTDLDKKIKQETHHAVLADTNKQESKMSREADNAAEIQAIVDKIEQDINSGLQIIFKRITTFYPLDPALYVIASDKLLFPFIKNIIMQIRRELPVLKDLSDSGDLEVLHKIMLVATKKRGQFFEEKTPSNTPLEDLKSIAEQFTEEENREFLEALRIMDYYQDFWLPEFMAAPGAPRETILGAALEEIRVEFIKQLTESGDPEEEYTYESEDRAHDKTAVLQAMRELLAYAPRTVSLQSKSEVCDYFEKYLILPSAPQVTIGVGAIDTRALSKYQILLKNFDTKLNNAQDKIKQAETNGQAAVSRLPALQQAKEECLDEKQRFLKNVRIYLQFRDSLEKEVNPEKKENIEALRAKLESFIGTALLPSLSFDPRMQVGSGVLRRITALKQSVTPQTNSKPRPTIVIVVPKFSLNGLRQTIVSNPSILSKVESYTKLATAPTPPTLPKGPTERRPSSAAFNDKMKVFSALPTTTSGAEPQRRASAVSLTATPKPPTFVLSTNFLARRNTAGASIVNTSHVSAALASVNQQLNKGSNTGKGLLAPPNSSVTPNTGSSAASNNVSAAARRFSANVPAPLKTTPSPRSQAGKMQVPASSGSQAVGSAPASSRHPATTLTQYFNQALQRFSPKKPGDNNNSPVKGKSPVKPGTTSGKDISTAKSVVTAAAKDKSPGKTDEKKSVLPSNAAAPSNGSTQRKKSKNNNG